MLAKESTIALDWANARFRQQHLFSLLLNCCITVRQLYQIHANTITNGFHQKNFIVVQILSLYVAFDGIPNALQVFEQVQYPSTALWNQVIRGHTRRGNSRKSIELLKNMESSVAPRDGYTYNYAINGCTKGGLLEEGEQIHGKVLKCGFCSDVFVGTSLVDFYAKSGGLEGVGRARNVFDEMGERNVVTWNSLLFGCVRHGDIGGAKRILDEMPQKSVVSWTTMIAGCAQNGRCNEALLLFHEMRKENVKFDQVTFVAVLTACAEFGDLNLGKWIHSYVIQSFFGKNQPVLVSLNNALIHMYASCSKIEAAFALFNSMEKKTIVSWTSMITGFAKQGYGDEALRVFRWMENMGGDEIIPDEITFLGVLCACSHCGYVDVGQHYFRSMTDTWGIKPRVQHFGCMIDMFSRAGLLDEAHSLAKTMPMKPNNAVWGALLGGCRIYKNVELASNVANWLSKELDPDQAAGYLVLLSNVFASNERWEDVVSVRQKILDEGTRKPAGRSWIQIEGSIYEFLAADRSNKHVSLIYEVLNVITRKSRLLGNEAISSDALIHD